MKVVFEGKVYNLTQDAHCDVGLGVDWDWQANAIDENGEECIVCWEELEGFDGDDCSNACDWSKPVHVIVI